MMAQRFPGAHVDAVDISPEACQQAMDNMSASPFAGRVSVHCDSVQHYAACPCRHGYYDSIVSNPPFFDNALRAPAVARNMARHTDALPFADLFQAVCLCLSPDGEFSAIIPFDYKSKFEGEALCAGLSLVKMCAVKTTPSKSAKRYLMAFRKQKDRLLESTEGVLETQPGVRSPWYEQLTSEFYL
jgi:tRNA1Val (adenine37-N6)-methyltransferase